MQQKARQERHMQSDHTVAGIDVGGTKKGFHLVVVRGHEIVHVSSSTDATQLHRQCMDFDVTAVGIDAPSQWAVEGCGRTAERELARERISCFSTPTEARATASTSGFYEWMFNGARVYQAFSASHPVLKTRAFEGARACFETFPHAITCAYVARDVVSAKLKLVQRRTLLDELGIDTSGLKSIDYLDAALCAHTARLFVEGKTRAYGDEHGGFIFVPDQRFIQAPKP
jgi:predicted nuclease with RNAse H fold